MACRPLALEMITGRLPEVAGGVEIFPEASSLPFAIGVLARSDVAPAAALPASDVRKNFRRVQSPIHAPLPRVPRRLLLKRLVCAVCSMVCSSAYLSIYSTEHLLHDDAKKLFLSCAKKEFARLAQVNVLTRIFGCDAVDLHAALLDQTIGFA